MIDTPFGETSTVEELHKFTQCGPSLPADWEHFDTSKFPVFIRVINRPAVIEPHFDIFGDLHHVEVIAEAETTTYVLETEDIEIADNAIWLIVGAAPTLNKEETNDPSAA